MEQFITTNPDIEALFTGYWENYVMQLPEAVFTRMNENFYRTTFYELCSRYLSKWLTFNIERSYPSGRSDLEFVGKFNEKFAGRRWIIEFKYHSNMEFAKFHCKPEEFPIRHEDVEQMRRYAEDLKREYPEVNLSLYLIYCFGNRGFKVFHVDNEQNP